MTDFVQLAEFDAYCRDEFGATESSIRLSALAAAERAVKEYIQRSPTAVAVDAAATARLYAASGTPILRIHDCRAVTAITVDSVALASTAYQLEPYSVSWSGQTVPYEQVRLLSGVWATSVARTATISVTARWGWVAVPDEIPEVVRLLAKDILQQRSTAGNLIAVGDMGGSVRMNTYVKQLLNPLRRSEAFGIA